MNHALAYLAIFLCIWGIAGSYDRRKARASMRDFRAMTPDELRALYEGGGSLKVETPMWRALRPLLIAGGATLLILCARSMVG